MELAAQAERRGVRMEAEWTPRDRNQEADDLSNLSTGGFDPDKEVKLDFRAKLAGTRSWKQVRNSTSKRSLETELRKKEERRGGRVKRKKEDKLKNREKW